MNWLYGVCMAWGMFLAIPCPVHCWRETARTQMLACLPLVGAVIGGLWLLLAWAAEALDHALGSLLLAALPWLASGFLHLDGFLDVCDATLSRRELSRRKEILKDSHCGAFGVIAMVLLALTQWSLFLDMEQCNGLLLLWLPVVSRGCAAVSVMTLRPMEGSQYAALPRSRLWLLPAGLTLAAAVVPLLLWRSPAPLGAAAAYALAVWWGTRQLDGMSGDVSGFALTLSELAGIAMLGVTI